MMSAPTPGSFIPATPGGLQAQTPFMPTGGDYGYVEEEQSGKATWGGDESDDFLLLFVPK